MLTVVRLLWCMKQGRVGGSVASHEQQAVIGWDIGWVTIGFFLFFYAGRKVSSVVEKN